MYSSSATAITSFPSSGEDFSEGGLLTSLDLETCESAWIEKINQLKISVSREIFPEAKPTGSALDALDAVVAELKRAGWRYCAPTSLTLNGDGGLSMEFFRRAGNSDMIELDRDGSIERIEIRNGKVSSRLELREPSCELT